MADSVWMMKIIFCLCLAVLLVSPARAAPATLAKGTSLDVMSGSTRIGGRNYPIGTSVDAVPAENGKVRVTADDGATALLPQNAVVYAPTPTPKPAALPAPKPSAAPVGAFDLKTLTGKVYKQARVFRVEPDGINYAYEGGVIKVPFTDLSEAIQKQYGYDPEKARKFAQQDADEQRQNADSQEKALQSFKDAKNIDETLKKVVCILDGKISQINDEGALVDTSMMHDVVRSRDVDTSTLLENRSTTQYYKDSDMTHLDQLVYIYGLGNGYVDGDHFSGKFWLVGTYRYTTVMGATKTVRAFSATKEDAARRIGSGRN